MTERRSRIDMGEQLGLFWPLLVAWLAAVALLVVAGAQSSVPLENLFLDPAHLAGAPWYTGVISNLGILCWTAGAVTSAFGAWVASQTRRPSAARFLATGALVGTVLLLDDLLQLHSGVLPGLVGVDKSVALALVLAPLAAWVVVFRSEIARTRWLMLGGFIAGSLASVAVDRLLDPSGAAGLLIEDGAKFLAVVAWATYFTATTLDIARSTITAAMSSQTSGVPTAVDRREGDKLGA